MEQVHDVVDKLFTEMDHIDRLLDSDDMDEDRVALLLASAKRVRRDGNILVRQLAVIRDSYSPEGTSA